MATKDFAFMTMLDAIRLAILNDNTKSGTASQLAFRRLSTAEGEDIMKEPLPHTSQEGVG